MRLKTPFIGVKEMIKSFIHTRASLIIPSLTTGLCLSLIFISTSSFAGECTNEGKQLRGSNEVLQGQGGGGMWGLMQQNEGYQSKAMIGMQIDSKLQRAITSYEGKCENGENPSKELANTIAAFIDRAREIKNQARRGSPDQIIPLLETLNNDLGKHLES
jgi:hypothetical protein